MSKLCVVFGAKLAGSMRDGNLMLFACRNGSRNVIREKTWLERMYLRAMQQDLNAPIVWIFSDMVCTWMKQMLRMYSRSCKVVIPVPQLSTSISRPLDLATERRTASARELDLAIDAARFHAPPIGDRHILPEVGSVS